MVRVSREFNLALVLVNAEKTILLVFNQDQTSVGPLTLILCLLLIREKKCVELLL